MKLSNIFSRGSIRLLHDVRLGSKFAERTTVDRMVCVRVHVTPRRQVSLFREQPLVHLLRHFRFCKLFCKRPLTLLEYHRRYIPELSDQIEEMRLSEPLDPRFVQSFVWQKNQSLGKYDHGYVSRQCKIRRSSIPS